MTETTKDIITSGDIKSVTPTTPAIKQLGGSPLGEAQVAVTQLDPLPDGFILPTVSEMKNGNEICDHPCDVEHEQVVDGRHFITSVIWTTDSGYGTFPRETIIGCQWVTTIKEWHEPICCWDNGWDDVVEVILDCDADSPDDVAITESMRILADVLDGNF